MATIMVGAEKIYLSLGRASQQELPSICWHLSMDREVSSIRFYYEMLHSTRYQFKWQVALKGSVIQRDLLHQTIGTALE